MHYVLHFQRTYIPSCCEGCDGPGGHVNVIEVREVGMTCSRDTMEWRRFRWVVTGQDAPGRHFQWLTLAPLVCWADHVTTRKFASYSPFFMAHSIEPVTV